jgi:two-component system response regulator YesN
MKLRSNKKTALFWKFLFSNILILLIPIIASSIFYTTTIKIVENDAILINKSILKQAIEIIDTNFQHVDDYAIQISRNVKVNALLYEKPANKIQIISKVHDVWKDIKQISLFQQDFIKKTFVYFDGIKSIITTETVYSNIDYFKNIFFNSNESSFELFRSHIFGSYHIDDVIPSNKVGFYDKSEDYLIYTKTLPTIIPKNKLGQIMIFVSQDKLKALMQPLYINNGGWAYIADKQGNIIMSVGDFNKNIIELNNINIIKEGSFKKSIKGESYIITSAISSYNNWVYVAAVPNKLILQKVNYLKNFMGILAVIVFLFGGVVTISFAYKNSAPIRKIFDILIGKNTDSLNIKNEYSFVQTSVTKLINNNEQMEIALEQQKSLLTQAFYERLFKGQYIKKDEIIAYIQHLNLKLKGDYYRVVILTIEGYNNEVSKGILQELEVKKILIRDSIKKYFHDEVQIADIDGEKLALILCENKFEDKDNNETNNEIDNDTNRISYDEIGNESETQKMELSCKLDKVYYELYNSYKFSLLSSIGCRVKEFSEICRSYKEANEASTYSNKAGKSIIWYSDMQHDYSYYLYDLETEQRLMNLVQVGDKMEVERLLNNLYNVNFVSRNLSNKMLSQLLIELKGTIVKIMEIISVDIGLKLRNDSKVFGMIDENKTHNENFTMISNVFINLCNTIKDERQNKNEDLKQKIKLYMYENYMSDEFCLTKAAEDFKLSETYFSKFFKDHVGGNFSTFLETIRMEKACELLTNTELKIDDLSTKIGYLNAYAFSRAFKRKYGITPTQYRSRKH